MCSAGESSSPKTAAMPPCAQLVLDSGRLFLVMSATEPYFAALMAKLSPAMPLPITTTSACIIPRAP